MIDDQGWFDWAIKIPGPPDKVYSTPCTSELYLPHSAVGWYPGWKSRLFSNERTGLCVHNGIHLPQGGDYTAYAAASVTGWFTIDGRLIQHFSIFKSCWASGSWTPNTKGNAFENAGGAPGNFMQPLTPEQVAGNIRACLDIQDYHKRKNSVIYESQWKNPRRPRNDEDVFAQLMEHNECRRWGSSPTACPSERLRYAWPKIVAALNRKEEDDVATDERLDRIFLKLDGSGDPVLFEVLDGGEPNGRKSIPLSRLDYIQYKARGFIISDVNLSRDHLSLISNLAHEQSHGHVIKA